MRLHLRLHGQTGGGRKCMMDGIVYAGSGSQLDREAKRMAEEGPWYYAGTAEEVPETEKIIVEHVENKTKTKR